MSGRPSDIRSLAERLTSYGRGYREFDAPIRLHMQDCLAAAAILAAQAGEAGTAETGTGSVHEHAVGEADAPNGGR